MLDHASIHGAKSGLRKGRSAASGFGSTEEMLLMSETDKMFRVEGTGVETTITFVEGETADPDRGTFAALEDAKAAARAHLEEQQALIGERLAAIDDLAESDLAQGEELVEESSGGAFHVIFEDVDTRIQFWDDSEPMGAGDFPAFADAKTAALEYLRWCLEDGAFHEEIKEDLPAAIARIEALEESDISVE
jgi:hypothetical protein